MTLNTDIKIAVVSDIHLFHPRTPTTEIINNLDKYLTNDKVFSEIDILFLAGDVFDEQNEFGDIDIANVEYWVARTLCLAQKHQVKIRVLEGTPSHDRGQSKVFVTVNNIHKQNDIENWNVDIKYVTKLDIEKIPEWDLNILYVPDEWRNDVKTTLSEVFTLLSENNLKSVDIGIVHGMFDYQCPEITKTSKKHSVDEYMKIVDGPIWVGHVHKYSNYKRIFAQGSFDRLAQGEEDDKGYLRCTLFKDLQYEMTFVINENAKTYKTIKCVSGDIEKDLKKIDTVLSKLKDGSFIRIETKPSMAIAQAINTLKTSYPTFKWDLLLKDTTTNKPKVLVNDYVYTPIIISETTLPELMRQECALMNLDNNRIEDIIALTMALD